MALAALAILCGLVILIWSSDKFIDGAAGVASHYKVPNLLIGMVIIGFGTSAPEMIVSAIAALQGNPNLALGNAYGSNISNMGLILGTVALMTPIPVNKPIIKKELPTLIFVTLLSGWILYNQSISRAESIALLIILFIIFGWSLRNAFRNKNHTPPSADHERTSQSMPLSRCWFWLIFGLICLMLSSRILVWGAVEIATLLGVNELIIGLTIVAIGTSLPELASSIAAVKKGEHDLAFGNVIGSNLFNTLAVVGIAGSIQPMRIEKIVFERDWLVMTLLTVLLYAMSFSKNDQGTISQSKGMILFMAYLVYNLYLISTII